MAFLNRQTDTTKPAPDLVCLNPFHLSVQVRDIEKLGISMATLWDVPREEKIGTGLISISTAINLFVT